MNDNTVETPWGDVTVQETTFSMDPTYHATQGIEVPTGIGQAIAAFSVSCAGDRDGEDTAPETVSMVLYGGYFSGAMGNADDAIGTTTLEHQGKPRGWRAQVQIDPVADVDAATLPVMLLVTNEDGFGTWDDTLRDAVKKHVREAVAKALDVDPAFPARLYSEMMKDVMPDLSAELEEAREALRKIEARVASGTKAMEGAAERIAAGSQNRI